MGLSEKNIEYHITKVLKALRMALKDYLMVFILFGLFEINLQTQKYEETAVHFQHLADRSSGFSTETGVES